MGVTAVPGSCDLAHSLRHSAALSLAARSSSTRWGPSCVVPHPGSHLDGPAIPSLCCPVLSTEPCPGHPVHGMHTLFLLYLCFYLAHICLQSASPSMVWELPREDMCSIHLPLLRTCHLRVYSPPCQLTDLSPAPQGSCRVSGPCHRASPPAGTCARGLCHVQWLAPACHSGFYERGVCFPGPRAK